MDSDAPPPRQLLRHAGFVRALARSLTRDAHRAEDLAQDAWLSALRRPPRHGLNPRGWLGTILGRRARREAGLRSRREDREHAAARPEALPSVEEAVSHAEVLRHVTEAVLNLEEPYRQTLIERFYLGRSAAAIARARKIPAATVRSRIKRALDELRRRLDRRVGRRDLWSSALLAIGKGGVVMSTSTKLAAATVLVAGLVLIPILRNGPPQPERAEVAGDTRVEGLLPPTLPAPLEETEPAETSPVQRAAVPPVPDEAAERTTGSLRVQVRYAADGAPARGVGVAAHPWNRSTSVLDRDAIYGGRRADTDEEGVAVLRHVAPGSYLVQTDHRIGLRSAEIVAGERAELTIELDGLDLAGVVVDENDVPVPGASVELAEWAHVPITAPKRVAVTDAEGRFDVRAVPTLCSVGARAPGHAPSAWHQVLGGEGGRRELRLVLQGPGGRLTGIVTGPGGEPLADAHVLVGRLALDLRTFVLPDGSNAIEARGKHLRTDADGRFRVDDAPRGEVPLALRALDPDLAPWTGTVVLDAREEVRLHVELEAGVVVTGIVTRADGEPAQGVEVEIEGEQPFTDRNRVTAADGSFRLPAVPAGEFLVTAETDSSGRAQATLSGEPGEVVAWNPRLGLGLELLGLVLDEADAPVADATVVAFQEGNRDWSAWTQTDAVGRFTLANCPDGGGLVVEVETHDRGTELATDVDPQDGELLLRLPLPRVPVRIAGEVRGPDGSPVTTASVRPVRAGGGGGPIYSTEGESGRIDIGELLPGTYRLGVDVPGLARYRSEPHDIAPGDTWDVGTIVLEHGGTLSVKLAETPLKVTLQLFDARGRWIENLSLDERTRRARSSLHGPGSYGLQVAGDGETAAQWIPLELRAGEDTLVEVTVERGLLATLRFGVAAEIHVRLEGEDGLVCDRLAYPRGGEPTVFELALEPGAYTLEASTANGLAGRHAFTVEEGRRPEPIDVDLR